MASNVLIKQNTPPKANSARVKPKVEQPKKPSGRKFSIFKLLDKYTNVDALFEEGVPLKYLPYILFTTLITLFYIGNTHFAEKTIRRIDKIKVETEDLRADYTTLKSDYMEASKQSEVARNVEPLGLVESSSPPYQVIVPADEY
ncbi:FtsL-like putative cell division protein [uncultured Pontibacter sp.]|uniref:FtsL-like putative cell division protein n=1 Tax=uncultured Pontibacter sp. TaxID=453356 RepID=UPI0026185447|nr:FtsL-like putative cell division protein [uncultured Pontibacter sp.]